LCVEQCYIKKLQDTEITRIYKEKMKKGITSNSGQQNNQNEETSQTKWENIKKVVITVASDVVRYEERKRNDGMMKQKVEEQNIASIKMLKRRMKLNTENYKNKQSEAKKICRAIKKTMALRW